MTRYETKHPDFETGSRGRKTGSNRNWEAERRTEEDGTRGENYIGKERTSKGAKKAREPQGFDNGDERGSDIKNRGERIKHGGETPERVEREATESDALSEEVRKKIESIRRLLRRRRR